MGILNVEDSLSSLLTKGKQGVRTSSSSTTTALSLISGVSIMSNAGFACDKSDGVTPSGAKAKVDVLPSTCRHVRSVYPLLSFCSELLLLPHSKSGCDPDPYIILIFSSLFPLSSLGTNPFCLSWLSCLCSMFM